MKKIYTLTKAEWKTLKKLSKEAQETPCFGVTSEQVLSGNDFAAIAYKRLVSYWKTLAKKYKFKMDVLPHSESKRQVKASPVGVCEEK